MAKLILYTALSLDYQIARADGAIDWLDDPAYVIEQEDFGAQDFYASIGYTLMGNNTYRQILEMDVPFPYPDTQNFVFSRFKDLRDTQYVKFVHTDVLDFVRKLKASADRDIWLIGGEQINTLLLQAGLIDQMILTILPVIIGRGIPLFSDQALQSKWRLTAANTYPNGFVQLSYDFIQVERLPS